ncbi:MULTISPECIES: flagellar assembly protein FliH [unclassified Polaromonas]|uniref:flagellar assembly protein FliH n=1 Tax=unclassified Polaromonas TaxID=2638319 RepID=UPI001A33DD9A|nr:MULTISPECIES: flagellar assembly protein FliH [unclassified Polaromonas]MBG6070489.1 flagellar assembly protein FliH [Polaromonas sp. CG_9.7]MBG6112487.1 flagellar assembly protein FliH [Polaromonas sp. CG_9.2]MDH6184137.1 flagellar assembly protein FliH [Polaromonas sp. CG_23.6]
MSSRPQQTAWQRWEMTSFAQDMQSGAAQAAPEPELQPLEPALLIDEAELARLRLEAQKTGEAEGHKQGYARGLAEGHAAGLAAGLAATQAQAGQLQALTLALPAALRLAESSVADDLLALALDVARQVLGQALTAEPQAILAVVHELLQAEPALSGAPQLLLHPDDAALVKELLADDLNAAGWRLRADAQITRGGCRVTASSGERDATVQARWERVAAALARSETPASLAPDSA